MEQRETLLIHGYINQLQIKSWITPGPIYDLVQQYFPAIVWGIVDDGLFIDDNHGIKPRSDNKHGTDSNEWKNAFTIYSFRNGVVDITLKMHGYEFYVGVIPTQSIRINARDSLGSRTLKDSIGYFNCDGKIEKRTRRKCTMGKTYNNGDIITIRLNFEQNFVCFEKNGIKKDAVEYLGDSLVLVDFMS